MLRFVICGIEHSGTTLISDLFRQVPGIDAGFEVGVLLADTPRSFPDKPPAFPGETPFAQTILAGWGIERDDLNACCDTDSFADFYGRLASRATVLDDGTASIFDKTPRYLADLQSCLGKVAVPFIVSVKDPRAIVYSDFTRARAADFTAWFRSYAAGKLAYLRLLYRQYQSADRRRACVVRLEDLCLATRTSCETVFRHAGVAFDLDYLILRNLRYPHTKSDSIKARIALGYRENFSADIQRLIRHEFAELADWFYD